MPSEIEVVELKQQPILSENERIAAQVRSMLDENGVKAVEFLGGPGCGKTSLIECLIQELRSKYKIGYIGADLATTSDTERISKYGVPVVQINTGMECWTPAFLVKQALEKLNLKELDLLFIENLGNLICPFEAPVGAHVRVGVVSVAEGEDKIVKYPKPLMLADVIVINKVDLAELLGINVEKMVADAKKVNPKGLVVVASAKTKQGIEELVEVLGL